MGRFINVDHHPIEETPVREHRSYPLLSLHKALEPLIPKINGLEVYINAATKNCHYPSAEGLTRDESAAIFLYTINWGPHSLHRKLNEVLRIQDRSALKPWHGFLKLFSTALKKLPSLPMNVWRGVDADIEKNYIADSEITWWSFTSCSKSLSVIRQFISTASRSTIFMIEAKNGKSIEKYSRYPEEHEVILELGTHLRVQSEGFKHGVTNLVHLVELSDRISPSPPAVEKEKAIRPIGFVLPSSLSRSNVQNEDNGRYDGPMKNGKRHGKGTCFYDDGDQYIGDWVDGVRTGYGIYTTKAGGRYTGQFHQGKCHGPGTYYFETGDVYTGDFVNDLPDGRGRLMWKDGNHYVGEFKNGEIHGRGTFSYANGLFHRGKFANGSMIQQI